MSLVNHRTLCHSDHWVRTQGNSCDRLIAENGFDCSGCVCDSKALVESKVTRLFYSFLSLHALTLTLT